MFAAALKKTFFFQLQSWAAYQLSGGRIVCLILGQQKPIGNYNTMGRSLEQNRSIIKSKRGGEGMVHTFLVDAGGKNIVDSFNSTVSKIFFARINIGDCLALISLPTMNCCCYFTVCWHYTMGNFELKLYKIDCQFQALFSLKFLSIFYISDDFQIDWSR